MPAGARVGAGALAAALAVAAAGLAPPVLLAALAAASGGLIADRAIGGPSAGRGVGAALVGAWLVTARLLLVGGAPEPPPGDLPAGSGPWTARVTAIGTPREGTQRLTVTLDGPSGLLLAVSAPRYPAVEPGDLVRFDGSPAEPPEGGYGDYLRRTGVAGTVRSRSLELLGSAGDPAGLLERMRRAAGDALTVALPEPAAGLAAGILIGLRDRVDRELAADFTTTGLSHVVAISGWNIALVAGLVGALLAGRARRTRSGGIIVAIVAYTVLAGASASVVRAAAMAAVALLAREAGRPGTAAAALGWAVAVLVVVAPANAADIGLQLSAAATAGLIAWSAPIARALERRVPRLPGWVREGLGVSLAAQAATLPIVLLSFGRVAPLSPALNLAVVPLVPLAMATGALALAGGAVAAVGGPALAATIAGLPGAITLGLLIGIVRAAATVPLASIQLDPPAGVAAAAILVGSFLAIRLRRRMLGAIRALAGPGPAAGVGALPRAGAQPGARARPGEGAPPRAKPGSGQGADRPGTPRAGDGRRSPRHGPRRLLRAGGLLAALAIAVLVLGAATRPDGRVHVVVLDVGQGDAILVIGPTGGRMLVDGGPDPDRLLVALDGRLPPWDRRLDLVVVTHPHEDHIAGLPLLLERYRVGQLAEPGMPGRGPSYEAMKVALATRRIGRTHLATGDRFVLDGIDVEALWPDAARVPPEPSDDGGVVNDSSIVLLGSFEGRRFLLAGDAEADVEQRLIARGVLPVDLLKAGHHGSRTSTTDALVAATRPRVAAISVGTGNDYGHPSREVLARLVAAGATVLRTDLVGTIDVALDARGVEVRTARPAPEAGTAGAHRAATRVPSPTSADARPSPVLARPSARPGLSYDRGDARTVARGRRRPPPLARSTGMAPPPRARRGRDRRLPRDALRGPRRAGEPGPRRGGRAPPRRRQAPPGNGSGGGAAARGWIGRLAREAGAGGARPRGRGPPGHAPRRRRGGRLAGEGVAGGAPRRLRRQAGRPAARADGRPVRRLAAPLPRRVERRGGRGRPGPGRPAGAGGMPPRRHRSRRGGPPGVDGVCSARGTPRPGAGRRGVTGPALGYYWGDDEYGLEAAAVALGRRSADPGAEPPVAWRTTGAATRAAEIGERVATGTLFGGGTLAIVEDPGPLVRAKADREALLAAMAAVAPGNALVFLEPVEGTARRPTSLEELAAAVAAAGGEVRQVAAPREGGMARWIEERATERGMRLERGAAEALARKIGAFVREGDVDRRRQGRLAVAELEKLAVYRLDAPVRAEDVDALVADAVPGSTWAFLDAVGSRRAREAAALLERLLETTPEPVLVAVLHRRIRDLLLVGDYRERGETLQGTARALKLKEYPARKLWEQGHAWRGDELVGALEGLLELDSALKGERSADVRRRRLAFSLWLAERVARA